MRLSLVGIASELLLVSGIGLVFLSAYLAPNCQALCYSTVVWPYFWGGLALVTTSFVGFFIYLLLTLRPTTTKGGTTS